VSGVPRNPFELLEFSKYGNLDQTLVTEAGMYHILNTFGFHEGRRLIGRYLSGRYLTESNSFLKALLCARFTSGLDTWRQQALESGLLAQEIDA
jgi:hypothetical protein